MCFRKYLDEIAIFILLWDGFFLSKTIPKNLDLSDKTDLDILVLFWKGKNIFKAEFMRQIQIFGVFSENENAIL